MRKLVSIQIIEDILPIEGADSIEAVQILGWQCVAKKGEFTKGDLCVYFEIDSLLPNTDARYSFLSKGNSIRKTFIEEDGVTKEYEGYRLKTIRLRGQISQGLALPIALFPEVEGKEVDEDVSSIVGVVKWEMPMSPQLAGMARGNFPSFIPKTDETRIQTCAGTLFRKVDPIRDDNGNIIEEPDVLIYEETEFFATEKLDGSSMTVYNHEGVFGVCSRNLDLQETEENGYWQMARKLKLNENLPDGYSIQGEIFGPGIQGNPLKQQVVQFRAFNVYNILTGEYLSYEAFIKFCEELGVQTVPIILQNFKLRGHTVQSIVDLTTRNSVFSEVQIEGLVFRPYTEIIDKRLGRLSFKAINPDFLLKHES